MYTAASRKRKMRSEQRNEDGARYFKETLERDLQDVGRDLPSFARKTEKGGYAHTPASRSKIGDANRGNLPWNKGKNRSEEDKAKIGAAVRERNAAVLAANLTKIGMTNEGYKRCKVDLKHIRERLRKGKIANSERIESEEQLREKYEAYWKEREKEVRKEEVEEVIVEEIEELESDDAEEQQEKELEGVAKGNQGSNSEEQLDDTGEIGAKIETSVLSDAVASVPENNTKREKRKGDKNIGGGKVASSGPAQKMSNQHMPSVFRKDLDWNANHFDKPDVNYSQLCPSGGPGGLICCTACTSLYSDFLLDTHRNLQTQHILRTYQEMEMTRNFLKQTNLRLRESIEAASKKPPPVFAKNPR